MSHTVKITAQFKTEHLSSFRRALEKFGWKLVEDSKIRTYYNDPSRDKVYKMIAQNPNHGYDLGIQFNAETGELEVMGDFYDGSISKTLGTNLEQLKQEYGCCVLEDEFAFNGYVSTREIEQDGTISVYGE
jgi:hypothetical protein